MQPNTDAAVCDREEKSKKMGHCGNAFMCAFPTRNKKYEKSLSELMESGSHNKEQVPADGKLKLGTENDKKLVNFVPKLVKESLDFVLLLRNEMQLCEKE